MSNFVARIRTRVASEGRGTSYSDLPQSHVRGVVDRQDRLPDFERGADGYTHVSSAIDGCARKMIIAAQEGIEVRRFTTGGHRVMWELGKAAERHVTKQFLDGSNLRGVWGVWSCGCGDFVHTGLVPDETRCVSCRKPRRRFSKARLSDDEYKLTGEPDLPFLIRGLMAVCEVKSMTPKDFEKLAAPKANHVIQAATYRAMFARRNFRVTDHVSIFYVNKQFQFGSPYKEFVVNATIPMWQSRVDEVFDFAAQVRDGHIRLPQRTCPERGAGAAKNCPCAEKCFSMT